MEPRTDEARSILIAILENREDPLAGMDIDRHGGEFHRLLSSKEEVEKLSSDLSGAAKDRLRTMLELVEHEQGAGPLVGPSVDDEEADIIEAFDLNLVRSLPELRFEHYFEGVRPVGRDIETALCRADEFSACSDETRQLFRWGLTPLTFHRALVAVSRVPEWRFRRHPKLQEVRILAEGRDLDRAEASIIVREMLVREVLRAIGRDRDVASAVLRWLLDASARIPRLFPRSRVTRVENDDLIVVSDPELPRAGSPYKDRWVRSVVPGIAVEEPLWEKAPRRPGFSRVLENVENTLARWNPWG